MKKQAAAAAAAAGSGKKAPPSAAAAAAAAAGSAEEQDSGIDETRQTADGKPYKPLFRTAYNFHGGENRRGWDH